jgi:oligosaccharyltransferase complex subunit delta (ribophorin II)
MFPPVCWDHSNHSAPQTHKDIPIPLLQTTTPLTGSIVIGSFGSSKSYNSQVLSLDIKLDSASPASAAVEPPLRYGKMPDIHHIFKPDPKSPPLVVTLFFSAAVLVALPALLGSVRNVRVPFD